MSIQKIHAREILDSRGNPTVEVDLYTAKDPQSLTLTHTQSLTLTHTQTRKVTRSHP
uniref:Enolase N-terminal domain-containing protein n=1 Tax=Callorhinchus milii TaxID=7868 RepID=A0A4W3GD92_CALMI